MGGAELVRTGDIATGNPSFRIMTRMWLAQKARGCDGTRSARFECVMELAENRVQLMQAERHDRFLHYRSERLRCGRLRRTADHPLKFLCQFAPELQAID